MTELGEPGPGAELVAHLGPVLERLAARPRAAHGLPGRRWAEWRDPADETPPAGVLPGRRRARRDLTVDLGADPADLRADAGPPTGALPLLDGAAAGPATSEDLLALFDAQATSRWLDVAAHRMRAAGQGAPHPGSAGREGMAAVALALRPDDPALPAYPPGAFHLARASLAGRDAAVADLATALTTGRPPGRGLRADGEGPTAPLKTAPGAAHLPRALGIAWALGRQKRARPRDRVRLAWPDDAVAVAGFGAVDANHSTTTGTVNAACWAALQGLPLPLLLVCEDDAAGSIPVPPDWLRTLFAHRPGLHYRHADTGGDPALLLGAAREAATLARTERSPVLLHLASVRIGDDGYGRPVAAGDPLGHLAHDPLVATMTALVQRGVLDGAALGALFLEARDRVTAAVEEVVSGRPGGGRRVQSDVTGGIALPQLDPVAARVAVTGPDTDRARAFPGGLPELGPPLTLAATLNRTLLDAGVASPRIVVLGPEVGRLGGGHGVTTGLQRRLGAARVMDTLPDEQALLGLALGAGSAGLVPVVELPHSGALHRAAELLRAQVATDRDATGTPLVLRVPWFAGVPTDDPAAADLGVGMLRDLPGVVVACAAHPVGAAALLRTLLAIAEVERRACVLLEPVRLYHERDLAEAGDGDWLAPYPAPTLWPAVHVPQGRTTTWGSGADLTIATFGSGLRRSLRAAAALGREGVGARVVDLRWLSPLPVEDVVREAELTGRLIVVDESRRAGGVSEGLVTAALEAGFDGQMVRLTSADPADRPGLPASRLLPSQDEIEDTARELCALTDGGT